MAKNSSANTALEYMCVEFTGMKEAYLYDLKQRAVKSIKAILKIYLEKRLATPLGAPLFYEFDRLDPVWKNSNVFTLNIKLAVPKGMQPYQYEKVIQPIVASDDFYLGFLKPRDSSHVGALFEFKVIDVLPKNPFITISTHVTLYNI